MRELFVGIDYTKDFCEPGFPMYVEGAREDVDRAAAFLKARSDWIAGIALSYEAHKKYKSAHHVVNWKDQSGNNPPPFSSISYEDVESGKWLPVYFSKEEMLELLARRALYDLRSFTVWPVHGGELTEGGAIHPVLMEAVQEWAAVADHWKGLHYFPKGSHPLYEENSALLAELPEMPDYNVGNWYGWFMWSASGEPSKDETPPMTKPNVNMKLFQLLNNADKVWWAGEASTHCLGDTILDALRLNPKLGKKFVVLTDLTSGIPGFDTCKDRVYTAVKRFGGQLAISTAI
jgi:nicotinamidase/pyrazinamidase